VAGVGFGLGGGAVLATPFRGNGSLPLPVSALVLSETGAALAVAGFAAAGAGYRFCALAFEATAAQAAYTAWAAAQKAALVEACARSQGNGSLADPGPLPGDASLPAATAIPSPLPALADVLAKVGLGCSYAAANGLPMQACTSQARLDLVQRNVTLANLYGQLNANLGAGAAGGERALALLRQYSPLANAAAMKVFAAGDFIFTGAEILDLEDAPVLEAGAVAAEAALVAGSDLLFAAANLVWADGYELERIAALANGQVAVLVLTGNAERRAALDRQDRPESAADPSSSSVLALPAHAGGGGPGAGDTGGGPAAASVPAGRTDPPANQGTDLTTNHGSGMATSGSARLRPALLAWFWPLG